MLLSMTGFGEARYVSDSLTLAVEVRTLNNRHLKVSVRGSEPYPMFEPELEKIVRRFVHRGSVVVQIRRQVASNEQNFRIDPVALRSYLTQLSGVCESIGNPQLANLLASQVLNLPGVVPTDVQDTSLSDAEKETAFTTLEQALQKVQQMRREDGQAMAKELRLYRQTISEELSKIRDHLPCVVENFRQRIHDRIGQVLKEANITLEPDHLIREIALFADRSDVAEEVTRLASHLDQFETILQADGEPPGRKLEFVAQEMGRETNTIGSKAGDTTISRHVVEIKATLEKIRELLQNVE